MAKPGIRFHRWFAGMPAPNPESAALESAWAELKLLLEWQEGFALVWVLGDDQRVSAQIAQRLQDFSQARTSRLQTVRPSAPESAASEVLEALFGSAGVGGMPKFIGPVWIDLMQGPDSPDWHNARQQTLSALNQRRSALEQDFRRPLLIHVPVAAAGKLVTWAPDLWSARALVAVLPNFAPRTNAEPRALRELAVDLTMEGKAERDGGRLDAAAQAYRESLELRRRLREQLGDTPQALRDLSVSLNNVGDVERDSGRMDAAAQAYRESLELRRRRREQLGDTPQALRDHSVSLNNVGDVERDSGRLDAALQAYRESLEIRRRLREQIGDTPQTLRDLRIVLNRLVALNAAGTSADAKQAWEAELRALPPPSP